MGNEILAWQVLLGKSMLQNAGQGMRFLAEQFRGMKDPISMKMALQTQQKLWIDSCAHIGSEVIHMPSFDAQS